MSDLTKTPAKPSAEALKLYSIGFIHGIYINQYQTGTDTADTFCKIQGSNGKAEGLWKTYSYLLELRPDHCSIARLKPEVKKQIEDWKKFEKNNSAELAIYNRLKAKFEGKGK